MESSSLDGGPAAAPGDPAGGLEVQVCGLPALRRVRVVECVQTDLRDRENCAREVVASARVVREPSLSVPCPVPSV